MTCEQLQHNILRVKLQFVFSPQVQLGKNDICNSTLQNFRLTRGNKPWNHHIFWGIGENTSSDR